MSHICVFDVNETLLDLAALDPAKQPLAEVFGYPIDNFSSRDDEEIIE